MLETLNKKWCIGTKPSLILATLHCACVGMLAYGPKDWRYAHLAALIIAMILGGLLISQHARIWERVERSDGLMLPGLISLGGRWRIRSKLARIFGLTVVCLFLSSSFLPREMDLLIVLARAWCALLTGVLIAPHLKIWEPARESDVTRSTEKA